MYQNLKIVNLMLHLKQTEHFFSFHNKDNFPLCRIKVMKFLIQCWNCQNK